MISELVNENTRFKRILQRLNDKSVQDYYNPYRSFEWPDSLPERMWWMTPDLTTVHGTDVAGTLEEDQLYRLSRYESVNFYSLNVHGIRELILEVVRRIHTREFEVPSEFFHHFIGEENEHMWFFAEFCLRYGGKIYRQPAGGNESVPWPQAANFLVFARILLFEELVDYFNTQMAEDERLHDTIRAISRIHHQDESRHIAFGRELVTLLFEDLKTKVTGDELRQIETYVKRYLNYGFESLFNPQAYRDAGIPDPVGVRRRLLSSPRRAELEQRVYRKPLSHLRRIGVLSDTDLAAARTAESGVAS